MLMVGVHRAPSLTREKYEEVVRRLTGKVVRSRRATSPSAAFWFTQRARPRAGFCVVDVWESEEAVARFREIIAPIAAEVGIEEPPDFFPAHTYIAA